jgi:hypothetical protein
MPNTATDPVEATVIDPTGATAADSVPAARLGEIGIVAAEAAREATAEVHPAVPVNLLVWQPSGCQPSCPRTTI